MKILFILLFALVLFIIERNWSELASRNLSYSCRCTKALVEPDETVQLECETKNRGLLAVMFVRVSMFMPEGAAIKETTESVIGDETFHTGLLEMRFSVRGRTKVSRKIDVTFSKRGNYALGRSNMGVGDLLGLTETTYFLGRDTKVVVMPRKYENSKVQEVLGGFLGEFFVRRWIMEDPILTRGFHDYTGREPFRDISWMRTAVSGKMMVKEYDHTSDINVMILLDLDTTDDKALERCYSLTRTVCDMLEKSNIEYGLRTNGGLFGPVGYTEWFPKGLGDRHYRSIMYSLGNARKVAYYSFATLLEKATKRQRSNENYIIIVPRAGAATRRLVTGLEMKTGSRACLLDASEGCP